MFLKRSFYVLVLLLPVSLSAVSFDEFPIGVWKPFYRADWIPSSSVASLDSVEALGANGVCLAHKGVNMDSLRTHNLKAILYPPDWTSRRGTTCMDYKFETYTPPEWPDTILYNPTAWLWTNEACSSKSDEDADNGWTLLIPEGLTGIILDSLRGENKYDHWGGWALRLSHSISSSELPVKLTYTLDDTFNVDNDCHEDPLCSLDSLCETQQISSDPDTFLIEKIGFLFWLHMMVAETSSSHEALCSLEIIASDCDTPYFITTTVYWDDFNSAGVYRDVGFVKFPISRCQERIELRVFAPDSGAPTTFWLDYVGARDAFANYLNRSAKLFNKASKEN